MDQVVNKGNKTKKSKTTENPFEEFDRFFGTDPIPCDKCSDIISWFGVGLLKLFIESMSTYSKLISSSNQQNWNSQLSCSWLRTTW